MKIDLNKEGKKLKELEEDLKKWQKYFRSGDFLGDFLSCNYGDNLSLEAIVNIKMHFQTFLDLMDKKQDQVTSEIEEVRSSIREELKFSSEKPEKSKYWTVSFRRTYKYDTEHLHTKALELGINPEDFYKVTKKFDPKKVPEELKEELKQARSVASITPSVAYKEES